MTHNYRIETLNWRRAGGSFSTAAVFLRPGDTAENPDPNDLIFEPSGLDTFAEVIYTRNERTGQVTAAIDYNPSL